MEMTDGSMVVIEGYEILSVAGSGGMSVVYKARQTALGRIVAIKMLHKHLITSQVVVQRFIKEAQITTTLQHPNIASIFACGYTTDMQPFIAIEFLEGKSLKALIEETGGLDETSIRSLFVPILEGLRAAHEAGIVHRDLKPGNVVLITDENGGTVPKIVDFGIAKIVDEQYGQMQRLTRTEAVIGSPAYMSPEQCTGGRVDVRSDIYSIGCMLFEAATGKVPFDADTPLAVMTCHVSIDVAAPSTVSQQSVSPALESIILKCLAKDPAERFQNCDEVLAALASDAVATAVSLPAKAVPVKVRRPAPTEALKTICLVLLLLVVAAWSYSYCAGLGNREWHEAERLVEQHKYIDALKKFKSVKDTFGDLSGPERAKAAEAEYWLAVAFSEDDCGGHSMKVRDSLLDKQAADSADARYLCAALPGHVSQSAQIDALLRQSFKDEEIQSKDFVRSIAHVAAARRALYLEREARKQEVHNDFVEAVRIAKQTKRPEHVLWSMLQQLGDDPTLSDADKSALYQQTTPLIKDVAAVNNIESCIDMKQLAHSAKKEANDQGLRKICSDVLIKRSRQYPGLAAEFKGAGLFHRAMLSIKNNKWTDAANDLTEATDVMTAGDREKCLLLGHCYEELGIIDLHEGKFEDAIAAFGAAQSCFTYRYDFHLSEACALILTARKWMRDHPAQKEVNARINMAISAWENMADKQLGEKKDGILRACQSYIKRGEILLHDKSYPEHFADAEYVYRRADKMGELLDQSQYRSAVRTTAYKGICEALLGQAKPDEAFVYWEESLKLQRQKLGAGNADVLNNAGALVCRYYMQHRPEKAIAITKEILEQTKDDPSLRKKYAAAAPIILAEIYYEQGKRAESLALFNQYFDEAITKYGDYDAGFVVRAKSIYKSLQQKV